MSANSAFNVTGSATGTGTVTSIGISSTDGYLAVANSPVTNSGVITLTFNTLPAIIGGTGIVSYNQGDTIYASASNTLSVLPKSALATRYLSNQGAGNSTSWSQVNLTNGVTGFLPIGNIVSTAGTPSTQFLRGDGTWAVPVGGGGTVTSVGATTPLASTGGITPVISIGSVIPLNLGGSNAALTASNGGLIYSTASALAILAGTATANQIPMSGASVAPSWSTATYLPTLVANEILFASATNNMAQIATAMNSVLATDASGVPAMTMLLPGAVQIQVNSLNNGTNAFANTFFNGVGSWVIPTGALIAFTYLQSGSGTFTPNAATKSMLVQLLGGGGGGGGTDCTISTFGAGGGGGSAGWCQKYITSPVSSYTYAVGTGGAGGATGVNAGASGTSTTFSGGAISLTAANGFGGGGGTSGSINQLNGVPGGLGNSSGGDINLDGNTGMFGISGNLAGNVSIGGAGGAAPANGGGGASANVLQMTGIQNGPFANMNSGGGGAGGAAILNAGGAPGGPGGSGSIIIYEYA